MRCGALRQKTINRRHQGRGAASPDTLRLVTESHYFDGDPSVKSNVRQVPLHLSDLSVELDVDRGVFSATKIDEGTQVLLVEAARPRKAKTILDMGCGYGPIACAVAKRAPSAKVWAVDVNSRARDLCASNAKRLGLDITVHAPEDMPTDQRFDLIVSNPPIRIGKKNLHPLLELWLDRLTPDGHAELVVHKHLGSDSLQRWLTEQGWATSRLTSRSGYRVLIVQPRVTANPSAEQAGPT
jgi:16S rRNA (guanine1207-N2)-methyltransferase